ncbi:hypothetical protein ACVWW4_000439 [Bradyrhizobium sp. LB7.1]
MKRRVNIFGAAPCLITGRFTWKSNRTTKRLISSKMRRQLTALRSQHSDNLRIATLLNRLLVKIAFLTEPKDLANAKYLRSEIEKTFAKVKEISARTKSD